MIKDLKKFFVNINKTKNNIIATCLYEILSSIISFRQGVYKISVDVLLNLLSKIEKAEIVEQDFDFFDENINILIEKFIQIDTKNLKEINEIFSMEFLIKCLKNSKHTIKIYIYLLMIAYCIICKRQKLVLSSLANNNLANIDYLLRNLKKNLCNTCVVCASEFLNNLIMVTSVDNKKKTVLQSANLKTIEVDSSMTERMNKSNINTKNSNFHKYILNVKYE